MPEHHDDFDLEPDIDRAFADLLEDVGGHTTPPSASTIIGRARRRRTTTFAAAAAVVLIVGAAAVASGVGRPTAAPGPAGQLPAPHVFDQDAWASATAGWVDGWEEPTGDSSALDHLGDPSCLASMPDLGPEPDRTGALTLASGERAIVFAALADFDDPGDAQTTWRQLSDAISTCADATLVNRTTWDGAEATSYSAVSSTSNDHFWFVRQGGSMAFVWVAGETTPPPDATDTRVMKTLVAGLQDPDSFQSQDSSTDAGSASGSPPAVPRRTALAGEFTDALGTWDAGWERDGGKAPDGPLPCLSLESSALASGGFGSSLGTNGTYSASWFADEDGAATALQDAEKELESCSTAYTVEMVGTQPEVVVASTDAGVVWIVRNGSNVGWIAVQGGHAAPPTEVSVAVGAVIDRALRVKTP